MWDWNWFHTSRALQLTLGGIDAVLLGIAGRLIHRAGSVAIPSRALTLFTGFMLASSSFEIARAAWSGPAEKPEAAHPRAAPPLTADSDERPDIYYIILDGYARQDTLKEFYKYDNSAFMDGLAARGFYVAAESRSNYFLSLIHI